MAEKGNGGSDAREGQWPDSLAFWVLITFGTIAVSAALCVGGWTAIRWLAVGSGG